MVVLAERHVKGKIEKSFLFSVRQPKCELCEATRDSLRPCVQRRARRSAQPRSAADRRGGAATGLHARLVVVRSAKALAPRNLSVAAKVFDQVATAHNRGKTNHSPERVDLRGQGAKRTMFLIDADWGGALTETCVKIRRRERRGSRHAFAKA